MFYFRRIISSLSKLLIITASLFALYLTFFKPYFDVSMLGYFTTHVLLMVFFLYLFRFFKIFKDQSDDHHHGYFIQIVLVYSFFLLIVYSFVVFPYASFHLIEYPVGTFKDNIIYFLIPALLLLDYSLFCKKGTFKNRYIPINPIYPVFYGLFIGIVILYREQLTFIDSSSLIYLIIDFQNISLVPFLLILLGLMLVLLFLSWLFVTIDYILGEKLSIHKK
jgi:hypothetical protein